MFQNDLAVDGIIRQCSAFLADADTPESHLLHTVFQNKLQASSLFSEAERNLCLQTHENSLPPVFFPPTALFPMRFLHSAAKERRTPAVFPGRKADFPTMRIVLRSRVGVDVSPEELTRPFNDSSLRTTCSRNARSFSIRIRRSPSPSRRSCCRSPRRRKCLPICRMPFLKIFPFFRVSHTK